MSPAHVKLVLSQIEMKEEDRLSAVVLRIDKETAVFPKGAYLRTSLNQVVLNKTFQGILATVS